MISFWEKNSLVKYHYIVIGAGITGLSVACELKEKYPKVKSVVLMINEGYGDVAPNEKAAEGSCERCKASAEFLMEFSDIMKAAQPGVKVLYKCN